MLFIYLCFWEYKHISNSLLYTKHNLPLRQQIIFLVTSQGGRKADSTGMKEQYFITEKSYGNIRWLSSVRRRVFPKSPNSFPFSSSSNSPGHRTERLKQVRQRISPAGSPLHRVCSSVLCRALGLKDSAPPALNQQLRQCWPNTYSAERAAKTTRSLFAYASV